MDFENYRKYNKEKAGYERSWLRYGYSRIDSIN